MHDHDRLLQRLHDGELSQAEAAGLDHLLAGRPDLKAASHRLDSLDALLKDHAVTARSRDVSLLEARIRERLPVTPPKRAVQISGAHLVTAAVLVSFVALAVMVANQLSEVMRDIVPVWSLAMISGACGLSLLIAARPLLHLEAGMLNRLLRRRMAVGDGEVLVCRVLGVALIVGGAHIAGLWG
jgi:anti-sigma factor RsiW